MSYPARAEGLVNRIYFGQHLAFELFVCYVLFVCLFIVLACGNLLNFLLRCGTRPYERGTQWGSSLECFSKSGGISVYNTVQKNWFGFQFELYYSPPLYQLSYHEAHEKLLWKRWRCGRLQYSNQRAQEISLRLQEPWWLD